MRKPRREVVRELTEAGMSTRAIAPVVGVSNYTVQKDREAGVRDLTPDAPQPSPQTPAPTIPPGEPVSRDVGAGHARTVTGIDGTRHRPPAVRGPGGGVLRCSRRRRLRPAPGGRVRRPAPEHR